MSKLRVRSFDDLLTLLGPDKRWVDEKYAAPAEKELLLCFYHQQLTEEVSAYVFDQINAFKSWRDAFAEIIHEQSRSDTEELETGRGLDT